MPLRRHLLDDRILNSEEAVSGYALRVAGFVVTVVPLPSAPPIAPAGASRAFVVEPPAAAHLVLTAERRELSPHFEGRLLFESGGVWRAFAPAGGGLVLRFHDQSLPFPYKEARLDADGRRGAVTLDSRAFTAEARVDPLEYPLDELLFQRLAASHGAIELHAFGVVTPSGRGLVFTGQSGDGKTTTARLWQATRGAVILSDDRVLLTRDGDRRWRVHGTPWHGEAALAEPSSAPLDGVFVLGRGERNTVTPLSTARAVALLFARSFPPFHDAAATSRLVERLETLASEVECRSFAFVPGPDAVRCILDLGETP